jgi:mono/diheme cytochrome c family protein
MTIRHTFAAISLCALGAIQLAAQAPSGAAASVTFTKDVAPIFYRNCTSCHRPGEIAPMSLLTYKDARPWVRSIGTKVANGSMPPWHADPAYGHFLNDRRLNDADKATIAKWIAAGAPEGSPSDLPPQPVYMDGWTIGRPDAIFSVQEDYPIPASGEIAYQYLEIPTNLTEDKWVQAFEVKPGDPKAVHHVIVYARPPAPPTPPAAQGQAAAGQRPAPLFEFAPNMDIPAGQTGGRPLPPEQRKPVGPNDRPPVRLGPAVGGFAPGQFIRIYQQGTAMKLPAGTTLVFQMHYTTYGKASTDRTRIGVRYATAPPTTQLRWASLANGALHIPAGEADHREDAEMTIGQDITMWSMLPHTHVRGKRWFYEVTYPDGKKETILSVPTYDFNWQTDYVFTQPLKFPKGTKIHATAWYDNSTANKSNPDATKDVWWGDQTWEEMMFTGLTFSIDPVKQANTAGQKQ